MKKFLFNLQRFNDENTVEEPASDLTLEDEITAFEKEWEASQSEDVEEPEEVEEEETTETEEVQEEQEEEGEPTAQEKTEEEPPKENEAWAKMRRELQEKSKYAAIVEKLAEQNGMSPDEVVSQFERKQLESEAQKQNVPVDVLERLKKLEAENQEMRQQQFSEKFNRQVEETKNKFELSEQQIVETFDYMKDNGLDPERVGFENAYKLANFDSLVDRKVEEARQKELASKKKRQNSAALPQEGSVSQQTDEITDDMIEQELKKMGLSI